MLRTTITLSQDEVDNLVEFFELEFLPMVQKDDTIDNLRYLTSMGAVYGKLEAAQKRLTEESDILNALENHQFAIWLQPQVEMTSGKLVSAEV